MANLSFNRIDTVISEETIESVKTNLQHISTQLPSYALTPQERKSFHGIDVANKVFTGDCIVELRSNGAEIMPSYIKVDDLIADFELFEQLDILKSMLNNLINQIDATQRIAGKEAYETALKVYQLYESAAGAGVPGAQTSFDRLKIRFKTNTGRKTDTHLKRK